MSVARIKKGDVVVAVAGVAGSGKKTKTGKVMQIISSTDRAIVEGLNLKKKALRKSEENPQGGISEKEGPIAISNLMLFCPKCEKGVRIRRERVAGKSVRKCKVCSNEFDS